MLKSLLINKIRSAYKQIHADPTVVYQILIVLVIFLFSYRTLLAKDFGGDFIAYFLPHYAFIFNSIRGGHLPLWFPYAYSGVPELYKSELAFFHPVTFIALICDLIVNRRSQLEITGNILEVLWFCYLAFGSIGMYRLCSRVFKLDHLSAFISSLVFALNPLMLPTMNTNVFLGVVALPWIIYSLILLLETPTYKHLLFFICANYLMFSAGYPYFYVYFFLCEVGLAVAYGFKRFGLFVLGFGFSFLLSAYFILPGVYIYTQSVRDNSQANSDFQLFTSNIPTRVVNIFNPMPFGTSFSKEDPASVFTSNGVSWGIFALVYLLIGLISSKKDKFSLWLLGTFLIALFYSFGGYLGSSGFFGSFIPFIDKFRSHSISLVLTMFVGCIYIGRGVDLTLGGYRNKYVEMVFWGLVVFAMVGISVIPVINPGFSTDHLPAILGVARFIFLMFASLLILHLVSVNKSKTILAFGVLILVLEFYFYFTHLNGHFLDTTYKNFYASNSLLPKSSDPKELYRVYFDNNQFGYNTSPVKVYSYAGYETIPYKGWYETQDKYKFNKSLSISNVKYFVTTNPNWSANYPGTFLVNDTGPAEKPGQTFVSSVDGLPFLSATSRNTHYIYQLPDYLPRFFVPTNVSGCKDGGCLNKENLPSLAVVKAKYSGITNPLGSSVSIDVSTYEPNKVVLNITTPAKTFIVNSDTWDSGWAVYINGKPSTLYKVSSLFRGFEVEAGNSQVVMFYTPPYYYVGLVVSLVSLLLITGLHFKSDLVFRKF